MHLRFPAVVFLCLAVSACSAQTCDPGSWIAIRIGGVNADANGQIPVPVGGTVPFSFGAGSAGLSFLMMIGPTLSCGAIAVPWGGTIDVASPLVFIDGIGGTAGPMDALGTTPLFGTLIVPTNLAGTSGPAYQGVWADATNPPHFLRNTAAARPAFVTAGTVVYPGSTYPDDGFITFPSTVPVTLYGQTYTTLYVSSNGPITFGAGSAGFLASATGFFSGLGASVPNPGAAAVWADIAPPGHTGDVTVVVDDVNQTVQVQHNDQQYWLGGGTAGSWSVTFGSLVTGSVVLDATAAVEPAAGVSNVVMGLTNGDASSGVQTIMDFNGVLPHVMAGGESVAGLFGDLAYAGPGGTPGPSPAAMAPMLPAMPVNFYELAPGQWSIFF